MESAGSDEPDILVIGEAPGETEDKDGVPFVGRAGNLLRNALTEVGYILEGMRFTNVVRCRPPDNTITKKATNACRQFVIADIERYNPPIVFLLGNVPLNAILGESGISNWNGVLVKKDDRMYVPLFHPAYILRNNNAMDEWLAAMMKVLDEDTNIKTFERLFPKTLAEVDEMSKYLAGYDYISFDTETATLDPFSKDARLLSVSFAAGDRAYALPINHKESWWACDVPRRVGATDRDRVVGSILEILISHNGGVIGHNLKYDQAHIFAMCGSEFEAGGDSMIVSHLLDSRQGIHGLKHLAGIHLGMYEYEQELTLYTKSHPEANPARGGSYDNVPLEILLPYGAMDAEATLRIHDKLYAQLSAKQRILYEELLLPVSDWLCDMEITGIAIDYYVAERYRRIYEIKRDQLYERILLDKKVKTLISKLSSKKPFRFNPNSFKQLQVLYYDLYHIPVQQLTLTGSPSTSSGALRSLEGKYPILKDIRLYKLLGKVLSTYIVPAAERRWSSDDGRVRTVYNMHGTRTGRLSSGGGTKRVNLQNIPTPEKEPDSLLAVLPVKNLFTHSYVKKTRVRNYADFQTKFGDGALVAADYSGMELRVFSALSHCQPMIEIHKSGKDFHSCVAIMALTGNFDIDTISFEDIARLEKAVRYRYKWTNWTLLYGGGAGTLNRMYDMPMDEAEALVSEYYHLFPQVLEYRKTCIAFAKEHGYIESPYGRREHLYYINDRERQKAAADERAAVNMPTQSAAYETLSVAGVIIHSKMREVGLESKMVNTVHDSLTLDCPSCEIVEVSRLCMDVMENVVTYAAEYMPNIDMSWLKVPLKCDVEVGSHYGAMMDLEKWKEMSHA